MELEMDELYLTIINNLNDGVYFVDLDRRILFWNKAAERITGYSAEEITAGNVRITYLIISMRTAGLCALSAVPCSLPS